MIKTALTAGMALALTAAPALAQDAADLRGAVAAFLAGDPVDTDQMLTLAAEEAQTGRIETGLYPGRLDVIGAPVRMTAPRVVTLTCQTAVQSTVPIEGFPPSYEETMVLTRAADTVGSVLYETVDEVSVLRMTGGWNDGGFVLERLYFDDQWGESSLVPTADGGLRDEVTGDVFSPTSQEVQTFGGVASAVVDVNPSWRVTQAEVVAGSPWLVPGREGDLLNAMTSLLGSSLGIPGAQLSENMFLSAVTGATVVGGAPAVVFEVVMDVDVSAPSLPTINMRLTSVEVYDVATFARVSMDNAIMLRAPGIALDIAQQQACEVSVP